MVKPTTKVKRTAVLVVHGMGSQRPLETVRGVVDAVWLKGDQSGTGERRIWTHPEMSGVDIDLPVITTTPMPGTKRRFDFHELYWAHLMSGTRAISVLLWLFELARRGPLLKRAMEALWWWAAIFLSAMLLSAALLTVHAVELLAQIAGKPEILTYVPLVAVAVIIGLTSSASLWQGELRIAGWETLIAAVAITLLYLAGKYVESDERLTTLFLPLLLAIVAAWALMGWWGLAALAVTYALSLVVIILSSWLWHFIVPTDWQLIVPWTLDSRPSMVMAWLIIGLYVILNAAFLEPYLGDVARYDRNAPENVAVRREIRKQAVDTLEALHLSGDYDRIVVVAHSLGTVVAYDMLRAYYARIRYQLPEPNKLGLDFATLDSGVTDRVAARALGRQVIAAMAAGVEANDNVRGRKKALPGEAKLRAWLVTDFVTLGSPLAHAYYLMCKGNKEHELEHDFDVRANAREFPTCPPREIKKEKDGWLTFELDGKHYFHHGGQFALTRWTNLYFPIYQLLWGDAIGGQLAPIFGKHVVDIAVYTNKARRPSFFAHILYWCTSEKEGCKAPHIVALDRAIDLADSGVVNELRSAQDAASSAKPV